MTDIDPSRLCILVTVYHPYRWCARFTMAALDRFWPSHPPVFFCGLTAEEAEGIPIIPLRSADRPRVWAEFAFDAASELKERGFEAVYFMLEDHMPLDACNEKALNDVLPEMLNRLPSSYIGLMGWDNRRFATRAGPILGPESFHFCHLTAVKSPRFHLHPSLFRTDVLQAGLDAVRRSEKPNPWGFEKLLDKPEAPLPAEYKASCHQIRGSVLALHPDGFQDRCRSASERFFFHRLMSLAPAAHKAGFGKRFWGIAGFDDFFYKGPFPMFFSGIMAGGKINPFFLRYLKKHPNDLFRALIAEAEERELAPLKEIRQSMPPC